MPQPQWSKDELAAVFDEHRELLLQHDIREYPSRKFKQGYDEKMMKPFQALLEDLVVKERMVQSIGEAALDKVDSDRNGAWKALVRKTREKWESWRKETILVIRIMRAHIFMKHSQYEKSKKAGIQPRSHNEWLIHIYEKIANAEKDENEEGDEDEEESEDVEKSEDEKPKAREHKAESVCKKEAESCMKDKILTGRSSGKAFFPLLVKAEEEEKKSTPLTWFDSHGRIGKRVLSDGTELTHTSVKLGPNGFLLLGFSHGPDWESELTNDLVDCMRDQVKRIDSSRNKLIRNEVFWLWFV